MTTESAQPPKHRIVIVGGGAGGLELATRLGDKFGRKARAEITLIERARTHVWKPKLHEIATGSMDMSDHEGSYLTQAHWHGFRYRLGEMTGIDRQRREVQVAPYFDEEGVQVTPPRSVGTTPWSSPSAARATTSAPPAWPSMRCGSTPRPTHGTFMRGWSMPASAPMRRKRRCAPSSCTWPSSAPASPAWSGPPSCNAPRAKWWPTGWTASTPTRT